ncbi:MAG: M20 family metallopeptidase [Fimbriimonadaceae bacterium]
MATPSIVAGEHALLTEFRRDLHAHPELMYKETRTSARVCEELSKAGIEHKSGLAGGTGVLGFIPATKPGSPTVALRADMDALPILEETGLPYVSINEGVMHACGHDGHTAIILGAARALHHMVERPNNVLLLFQPAEEGGAGAKRMCDDGCLDGTVLGEKPSAIFGLHGNPSIDEGIFTVREGPMLAATDEFRCSVTGRGGHAAMPHLGTDPVVAVAQIVSALQTVASRNVSPLDSIVFSVTVLEAGHAHNVIPDTVRFAGTMRSLLPETRELGRQRFHQTVEGIARAMECRAEVDWHVGYPVTANDPWATRHFRNVAQSVIGSERLREEAHPTMGGEDFSYYGEHSPACFFFVGLKRAGDESPALLHTPRFDFNDAVIPDAVATMVALAVSDVRR